MCYFIKNVCYFQNAGQMVRQAFAARFVPTADRHSTGDWGPEGALLSVHPKPSLTAVRDDSLVKRNRSDGARARIGLPRLQCNLLLVFLVREGPSPCSLCCCVTYMAMVGDILLVVDMLTGATDRPPVAGSWAPRGT